MILFEKQDDLFESELQTLVCPVNTVGTLGKGLALAFKHRFPDLLVPYQKACDTGVFRRQGYFVYTVSNTRKILCLPTKRHWRNPSKLEWIDFSFGMLAEDYAKHKIASIAIPAVGCGEGGLPWMSVRSLIYAHFESSDLLVGIYSPVPVE